MDIKEFFNKNGKLVLRVIAIIFSILFIIKSLNFYYENTGKRESEEIANNIRQGETKITQEDYTTKSNSVEITMASFVNYCNSKELVNAYEMLTDECKKAMFPTIEDFERIYINNIYNVKRNYDLARWSTEGNKITYLVTLYEDMLTTGGNSKSTQEYCTFIKQDDETYKLNINNYIYGQNLNVEKSVDGIVIKVKHVNVYQEYEELEVTVTNNRNTTICLTENKNNVYLEKPQNTKYSSINSRFDRNELILLEAKKERTFNIKFNKQYDTYNMGGELVIEDVILDYDKYLNSEDEVDYSLNRKDIRIDI